MKKLRKKQKRQKLLIIINLIVLMAFFTAGYAAFQTVIRLNTKGNIKTMYSSDTMKKLLRNNSLTMFTDSFGNIRYTGPDDDVHNYVCIADESPCQDKHLFRIIGSFIDIDDGTGKLETRVKIISTTIYGNDYWDTSGSNDWGRPATLNTTLNTTYYDSLDSEAKEVVGNTIWNLGGHNNRWVSINGEYSKERSSEVYCSDELDSTTCNHTTWTGKIALMYATDYAFASSDCQSGTQTIDPSSTQLCKTNNWLNKNVKECSLTHRSNVQGSIVWIGNGNITAEHGTTQYVNKNSFYYRPSLYLKSNTLLITQNHDGTNINPYIAKLAN